MKRKSKERKDHVGKERERQRDTDRKGPSRDGGCAASGQECLDCGVKSSGGRWRCSGDDGWIDSVRERERERSRSQ